MSVNLNQNDRFSRNRVRRARLRRHAEPAEPVSSSSEWNDLFSLSSLGMVVGIILFLLMRRI
jgi:hypothetical protein